MDVQDSILMITKESLNLHELAERYRETAGYYYHPESCKKNLTYLITEMEKQNINANPLKEMSTEWIP